MLHPHESWEQAARLNSFYEPPAETPLPHKAFLIFLFLPIFLAPWPAHPLQSRGDPIGSFEGKSRSLKEYKSYLLAKSGRSEQVAFFFDLCLAKACDEKKLVPDALFEAQKKAKKELQDRGEPLDPKLREDLMTRFTLLFLHGIRLNALAPTMRKVTDEALHQVFDRVYGVDGLRARVRHVLVSFIGTRELLRKKLGREPTTKELQRESKARIDAVEKQLKKVGDFGRILHFSDDPSTQTLLQDPRYKKQAGEIPDYNFQRFGIRFAEAVRNLKIGEVSRPVRSSHGWHLIQLLDLRKTRFEDVREDCKERFLHAAPDGFEERRIRQRLFERYKVQLR